MLPVVVPAWTSIWLPAAVATRFPDDPIVTLPVPVTAPAWRLIGVPDPDDVIPALTLMFAPELTVIEFAIVAAPSNVVDPPLVIETVSTSSVAAAPLNRTSPAF